MPRKRKGHPDRYFDPFPTRLRQLLDENDLSHQAFGEYLGVARQSVGNYCDGSVSPSAETLSMVADYFSVSTDYLLGRTEVRSVEPSVMAACDVTGLSERSIQVVHDLCTEYQENDLAACFNEIIGNPNFSAAAAFMNDAWYLAKRSNLLASKSHTEQSKKLRQAIDLIEAQGFGVTSLEERSQRQMEVAANTIKNLMEGIIFYQCNPPGNEEFED